VSADIIRSVIERGDLAHLALFLWAAASTLLAMLLVRELTFSNRRFSHFVEEIARLNRHLNQFVNRPAANAADFERRFNSAPQDTQKTREK
jgi:hypothetical protein